MMIIPPVIRTIPGRRACVTLLQMASPPSWRDVRNVVNVVIVVNVVNVINIINITNIKNITNIAHIINITVGGGKKRRKKKQYRKKRRKIRGRKGENKKFKIQNSDAPSAGFHRPSPLLQTPSTL